MRKRLKVRALTFVAAVILIVSCIVVPCSAASSFPDNYANFLDCDELFTRLSSKINTALYDFGYDASVGTCTLTSKNENNYHLGSAFIGTIQDICPGIKAGVWYTFHCEEADSKRNFSISWENYTREVKNGDVFMLDAAELTQQIFISVYNVIPADKLYTYAHLAIVPSSMPLSGNFTDQTYPSYFNYDQALDDAKQQVINSIDKATFSLFRAATLNIRVTYRLSDSSSSSFKEYADLSFDIDESGAVDMLSVLNYVRSDLQASGVSYAPESLQFGITFSWPIVGDTVGAWNFNDGFIFATYNKRVSPYGVTFSGFSGGASKTFSAYQRISDGALVASSNVEVPSDMTVTSLFYSVSFGASYDSISYFAFSSDVETTSPLFGYGYAQGYIDGENAEFGKVKQESYTQGYDVGYIAGKKDGIKISETGDWRSLISSVVEAPVNYFQSLFHFEILGLDMRVAFGSILALCVLLIIVKKVIL